MSNGYGDLYPPKRPKYIDSLLILLGHLVGTTLIFGSFFVLIWLLSYLLSWLHGIHQFPQEIFEVIQKIELGAIYVDAGLCVVVLIAGMLKFCKDIFRG